MPSRKELIDAIIDGKIGKGIVVTRQEVMDCFAGKYEKNTTGCILSNSVMETSSHSPTYIKFTLRLDVGVYRIHPQFDSRADERAENNLNT